MSDVPPVRPLAPGRGSRNEATRSHNLSTILSLVHHSGGISRAELTRATELNRSTIAALVGDLVEAELVFEDVPETGSVGRPSPIVRPHPAVGAIAVNPDVDAVAVGLVTLGGAVRARTRVDFSHTPTIEQVADAVAEAVPALRERVEGPMRVYGVGAAVPGLVRREGGVVARAPHLEWLNQPFGEVLEERLGMPAAVDNDANAALLAETIFGAGSGMRDFVYLNGSTSGIGGAVLVGGTALRGADGFAGELGHTLVTPDGVLCHCGRRGCLETEVNLQRIEAACGRPLDHAHLEREIDSLAGDASAAELLHQATVLSRAIASFVSVFNPQAVLLGGFLGAIFARHGDVVRANVKELAFAPLGDDLLIQRALLRDNLQLVGAAELAFARLLSDPLARD